MSRSQPVTGVVESRTSISVGGKFVASVSRGSQGGEQQQCDGGNAHLNVALRWTQEESAASYVHTQASEEENLSPSDHGDQCDVTKRCSTADRIAGGTPMFTHAYRP